jgi:hypothetical protein
MNETTPRNFRAPWIGCLFASAVWYNPLKK